MPLVKLDKGPDAGGEFYVNLDNVTSIRRHPHYGHTEINFVGGTHESIPEKRMSVDQVGELFRNASVQESKSTATSRLGR